METLAKVALVLTIGCFGFTCYLLGQVVQLKECMKWLDELRAILKGVK